MLYTIDERRETGFFTQLMNGGNGMLNTFDEWRETECFTQLMN